MARLIGLREAASFLGVSRMTAYAMARDGEFTIYRVRGRIKTTIEDLEAYLARVRVPAAATGKEATTPLDCGPSGPGLGGTLDESQDELDLLADEIGLR